MHMVVTKKFSAKKNLLSIFFSFESLDFFYLPSLRSYCRTSTVMFWDTFSLESHESRFLNFGFGHFLT